MAVKRMERYMELMEKAMAEHEGQSGRAASSASRGGSGRKHLKKGPGTGGRLYRLAEAVRPPGK